MSVTAFLVVVVSSGDARDAVTLEAVAAASQALGGATEVRVNETVTGDDAMVALSNHDHAAVASLVWDATRSSAVVHFHASGGVRWIDRTVVFDPEDAPRERGRALGFTLASMMPEAIATAEHTPVAPVAPEHPLPVAPTSRWRGSLDASASGVVAVSDSGTAIGGDLGVSLFFGRFGVRASGSVRAGDMQPAQASALYVGIGLGLVAELVEPHPHQRFGFGVRTDALVQYQLLTRASPSAHEDRWLPGVDLVTFATFDLAPSAAIFVGIGAEASFGTTSIYIGPTKVGQLVPIRPLGDVGFLARF